MDTNQTTTATPQDFRFPLLEGGPLHELLVRAGLVRPDGRVPFRWVLVAILVTWVPLLILSWMQGLAFGDRVHIPLLLDFGQYSRLFVALPLLIIAETVIAPRLSAVAAHFVNSGLVREEDCPAWEAAIQRALRLRDSVLTEAVILILAYVGTLSVVVLAPSNVSGWPFLPGSNSLEPSWAGWWFGLVALPLYQFLVYRWLWRLLIWYGFLWRMSRLDLNLIPTHPDHAGGMGSVGRGQGSFSIVAFALMAAPAGVYGREIFLSGGKLVEYRFAIAGLVALSLIIFLGPMLMFSPHLIAAWRKGLKEYGLLATTYCRSFHGRWVTGESPSEQPLLGSADIQSLADLGNSYQLVSKMRFLVFDARTASALALASLAPMLPLVASVIPMRDISNLLLKLLF